MGRLSNKIALITGGARGQGAAEARLFANEGATVIICDVLEDEGSALADEISANGASASFKRLDVTDAARWQEIASEIHREHGGLDILINNAGINLRHGMTETCMDDWNRLLDVNLTGVLHGIQACAPLMRKRGGGSIVNTGSLAGTMGHPTTGYSAAKWGLRGLTKSAALDLVKDNIRVNAMHPGLVATPIIDPGAAAFKQMQAMTPMQRPGRAEELAYAVLFLASDESSFITGIDLPVDGGFSEIGTYNAVWSSRLTTTD
ncbi:MAG: SDR family NAD(P)-dependent oxidoreductase [Novosphingobium sp.]